MGLGEDQDQKRMRFDSLDQKAHDIETIALDLDKIVCARNHRYQIDFVLNTSGIRLGLR